MSVSSSLFSKWCFCLYLIYKKILMHIIILYVHIEFCYQFCFNMFQHLYIFLRGVGGNYRYPLRNLMCEWHVLNVTFLTLQAMVWRTGGICKLFSSPPLPQLRFLLSFGSQQTVICYYLHSTQIAVVNAVCLETRTENPCLIMFP